MQIEPGPLRPGTTIRTGWENDKMADGKRRVKCVGVDCANMILPTTAEANAGLCAPCAEKRQAEERRRFIAENKRLVDPYEGITDRVELIRAIHTVRKYDALVEYAPPPESLEELHAQLSADEAEKLMDGAAEALNRGDEYFADEVAVALATLTDFNLDRMLRAFVRKNIFRPSIVFRNAGEEIRSAIIAAMNSDLGHADHALSALAWIGDETVCRQFEAWDLAAAAAWREHLLTQPSKYSRDAGWEIVAKGRRDLFHRDCFAIETASADRITDGAVAVAEETREHCPWCQQKLVHLLDIDLSDARFLFLNVKAKALPVLTCSVCTCYGNVFAELTSDGVAQWSDCNVRPKYLPADSASWSRIPWQGKAIALRKRRAIEAGYWCASPAASQVGGMPTWIQHDAYPDCPWCKRTMMFVGQVDQSAFDGCEGIYYGFLCAQCRITGTTYQQS
jgi:hypothetical protein